MAEKTEYRIIHTAVTGSTNSDAKRLGMAGESDLMILADRQTDGRGRLGRSFISDEGGLYMTMLFAKHIRPTDALKVTVYTSLCVSRAIDRLMGLAPKIKWVNDIYLGGKKLSGILCEGLLGEDGNFTHVVVGIGLNVSGELPEEIRDIATALDEHTTSLPKIKTLAKEIADEMYRLSAWDFSDILREYKNRSCVLGKRVRVKRLGREEYTALAVDVDSDGALVLRLDNGGEERLATGEISVKVE